MAELRFEDVAAELEWDGGLRDLLLLETTVAEWEAVFATVVGGPWPAQLKLSDVEVEFGRGADVRDLIHRDESALLSVDVAGAIFNCHFFCEEEIEFDLWPTEVTRQNFGDVLRFVRAVAEAGSRNAYFAHEGGPPGSIFGYRRGAGRFHALSRPTGRTSLGEQLRERLAPLVALFPSTAIGWVEAAEALQEEAGATWKALYHPDQWDWHTDLTNREYGALSEFDTGVRFIEMLCREDAPTLDAAQVRSFGDEFWKRLRTLAQTFDIQPEAPQ